MHVSDSIVRWCGGLCLPLHAYSVPSTSTWCHLGGSYIHILYVFVPFCKMKACIILCCMIVLV